jgi:SAM-dependent methyltransferase
VSVDDIDQSINLKQRIDDALRGYRVAQVYLTFAELGLGEALGDDSATVEELAQWLAVDLRALDRFIDAAKAFEIVEQRPGNQIALTNAAQRLFSPSSPHSIANQLRLESAFYQRWGRLPKAIRIGTRPPENRAQEDAPDWVRRFTLALYDNARRAAPKIAHAIDAVLPAVYDRSLELIDVGGGHGAYALETARRRANLNATVFDLPPVIDVTREIVSQSDVSDRVRTVAGDFHSDPLGAGYDVALLFGVLHGETPENAPRLLRTLRSALAPGGLLLIRSRDKRTGEPEPGERELLDLHMLLSTEGGEVRRSEDTATLVQRAGFVVEDPQPIEEPVGGQLLVFRNPKGDPHPLNSAT